ncbi:MAG: hypothetical protein RIS64_4396, partial [Bacteroidota bacterium]
MLYRLFILTLFPALLTAQNDLKIGEWRSYLPYHFATGVAQSDEVAYFSTPWSVMSLHKKELSTQYFDKSTGLTDVSPQMIQYATPGGKILYYGVAPDEARVEISPYEVFRRDLTILGSFSLLGTTPIALEWLQSGRVQVKPLITHRLPIEQLKLALE